MLWRPKNLWKKVGGDIIENKKRFYIILRVLILLKDLTDFEQLMSSTSQNEDQKIKDVKAIYESTNARRRTTEQVMTYTKNALDALNLSSQGIMSTCFTAFAEELMVRIK